MDAISPVTKAAPMIPCPNCGHPAEAARPEPESIHNLARVSSAAEAGYLIHLLEELGLRATARPLESFDAVTGVWATSYLIAVDASNAAEAARVLQAESQEGFAEAFGDRLGAQAAAAAPAETSANPWSVLAVLAVVATTGAMLTQDGFGRGRRAPQVRVEPAGRLLEALAADPTPLRSEGPGGGPRRRLRLDSASGLWELSTDADLDGRYETTRRFAAPAVGR